MTPRQKQLRPASFRGVEFHVEESEFEGGRRTQVHEYPQRDQPYVEDIGRAAREFSFTGFIVGDDYIDRVNKLVAALEQAGPGTLVHPWLGTMQASLRENFKLRFRITSLGNASIDLAFVEGGALAFPTATASTPAATRLAADGLTKASAADFAGKYKTKGVPDFVASATAKNWSKLLTAAGAPTSGTEALKMSSRLTTFASTALDTSKSPRAISDGLTEALDLTQFAALQKRWPGIVQGYLRLRKSRTFAPAATATALTPARAQAADNIDASNALVRRTMLAQAIGASSVMSVTVVDDAQVVRAQLLSAIDDESLTASDAVYAALQAARDAVFADLTARARGAAKLRNFTPADVLPSLVVAYQLYGNAGRSAEIVERNRVPHPGFVQPNPIKVLSA